MLVQFYIRNRNSQYVVKNKDGNRHFVGDVKKEEIFLECQRNKADDNRHHYNSAVNAVGQTVAGGVDNFVNLFSHLLAYYLILFYYSTGCFRVYSLYI